MNMRLPERQHPNRDTVLDRIRSDREVGRYSCSPVDEAMSDDEVLQEFGWTPTGMARTPLGALQEARRFHRIWTEIHDDIAGTAF